MSRPVQIGIGLLIAFVLIACLQWWVVASEAVEDEPSEPAVGLSSPMLADESRPDTAAGRRGILDRLSGRGDRFHLATDLADLPKDCAPVIRVLPGGAIRIDVAPPVAMQPGPLVFPDVGILLPRALVGELTASERGSLLRIWSRLAGPKGLSKGRIRTPGCRFGAGELEQLLTWMR